MAMKRNWTVFLVAAAVLAGASSAWATHNPHLGRFMQRDPLGYPDGMNGYQGCRSQPVSLTDPAGTMPVPNWDPSLNGPRYDWGPDIDLDFGTLDFFLLNDKKNKKFMHKLPCSTSGVSVLGLRNCSEDVTFQDLNKDGCKFIVEQLAGLIGQAKKAGWKPDAVTSKVQWLDVNGKAVKTNVSVCELVSMLFKAAKAQGKHKGLKQECPKGYECCEDRKHSGKIYEKVRMKLQFKYHDIWGTPRCLISGALSGKLQLEGKWGQCAKQ